MTLVILLLIVLSISMIYLVTTQKRYDDEKIVKLTKAISRWSLASMQDNNVFIANLHANYGVGYLQALKDIYTEMEIKNATGIDIYKFTNEIVNIQDTAARKLVSSCPEIGAKNKFLASLAGE